MEGAPSEVLKAMLVALGIAEGPAEGYAVALADDGFDTEAAFNTLALEELRDDFGFKRGHLRMVEKAREAALGQVPADDPPHRKVATAPDGDPFAAPVPDAAPDADPFAAPAAAPDAAPAAAPADDGQNLLPLALPSDIGPERTIFGSMRFPVPPEARTLAEALKAHGIYLKIVDLRPGADISTEVFAWIEYAHTFIVFGTQNYGEDTGNPASSCAECKYAQNLGKRMILLRMTPWDQHFEHLQARVIFGMNKLTLFWAPGTTMPADVIPSIVGALDQASQQEEDDVLRRVQSAPQHLTGSSSTSSAALSSHQLSSASEFASSCGSSVEELLGLSSAELKELMKEQEGAGVRIGILGRKRIMTEIVHLQQNTGSPTPRSSPGGDAAEPEPVVDGGDGDAEEQWDEEPDIMLIGDEEQVTVLLFLDLPDLASMARVSRHWRTLISDDFFWERKYSWCTYACAPPTTVTPSDGSLPQGVLSYRTAFRRRSMWWTLPGLCIEVLDTYNIWSVARVLLMLDENHMLIWFEGWGDEWLMWLDRRYDLARVRPCGQEVAGLGKRGAINEEALIQKQRQAIDMICESWTPLRLQPYRCVACVLSVLDLLIDTLIGLAVAAPSQRVFPTGVFFPHSNVWKVPQCSPSQGVQPSCYCRGWMEDQKRPIEQRTFNREWRDMEDPGRVVVGGAKQAPLEGFDTWHSALSRNPPRPSEDAGDASAVGSPGAAESVVPNLPEIGQKLEAQDMAGAAWASQQQAAMRRRPWLSCAEVSDRVARSGAQSDALPPPLQHVSAVDSEQGEAEAPWYCVIQGAELRRSWQPDSAVLGELQPREVVQVMEIVTGQRHFPTDVGVLDLRAMARCEKGWFECRNRSGATAVRPADPPRES